MVKNFSVKDKIESIILAGLIMAFGIVLFKFVPSQIFGKEILFDASLHLTIAVFILYILWYFVDQNKSWRVTYFIFAFAVIVIIAVQRIISNAHNDIGLLTGLLISVIAIIVSRYSYFKNKISF